MKLRKEPKMRPIKLLLLAVLICALILPTGFAEDGADGEAISTAAPATEVPAEPAATAAQTPEASTPPPTSASTQAPTDAPADTPTPAPTDTPTDVPTEAPTDVPTVAPTDAPTDTPTEAPTDVPTVAPTETPAPEPTPSATPLPQPGAEDGLVSVSPEGSAQNNGGVWSITLANPDAPLAFSWTCAEAASGYLVYAGDTSGSASFISETQSTRIELSAASYMDGRHIIYVGAVRADGSVSWGSATFEIAGGFPGGRPGGMGGFGGKRSGGAGGAGDMMEAEMGFRVTPGEALTSSHASGSADATAYICSTIESTEEAVRALVLESTQAEITLDGGESAFTAIVEDGQLTLTPESGGSEWRLSALAMTTLAASGVERVVFDLDTFSCSLPSELSLSGSVYASLRAQGYVSKDCVLSITTQGLSVDVAGSKYSINQSGELVLLEG